MQSLSKQSPLWGLRIIPWSGSSSALILIITAQGELERTPNVAAAHTATDLFGLEAFTKLEPGRGVASVLKAVGCYMSPNASHLLG